MKAVAHDKFGFEFDLALNIVKVNVHGFWSITDTRSYIAHLRDRVGNLRVIIDLRGWPVQSTEVSELIGSEISRIYVKNDRIATIMESALLTMQVNRIAAAAYQYASFASPEAAEAWIKEPASPE